MPAKVLDASALAALVFAEPRGEALADQLELSDLHAIPLLFHELANVAWKKSRRHPAHASLIRDQFNDALALSIRLHDIDHTAVLALALETGLTAYDAAYLWLAEALGSELVTLDAQLESVATSRRGS